MLILESHKSSKLDEVEGRELDRKRGVLLLKQVFSLSWFCSMSTTKSVQWGHVEKALFPLTLMSAVLKISILSPGERLCLSEAEMLGFLLC